MGEPGLAEGRATIKWKIYKRMDAWIDAEHEPYIDNSTIRSPNERRKPKFQYVSFWSLFIVAYVNFVYQLHFELHENSRSLIFQAAQIRHSINRPSIDVTYESYNPSLVRLSNISKYSVDQGYENSVL